MYSIVCVLRGVSKLWSEVCGPRLAFWSLSLSVTPSLFILWAWTRSQRGQFTHRVVIVCKINMQHATCICILAVAVATTATITIISRSSHSPMITMFGQHTSAHTLMCVRVHARARLPSHICNTELAKSTRAISRNSIFLTLSFSTYAFSVYLLANCVVVVAVSFFPSF